MASLLEGKLAKAIYQGFKGKLLKGTLRRESPVESGGLDTLGDPLVDATPQTWDVQGYVDSKVDRFLKNAGIPHLDGAVYIFAASLPAGVAPLKDDKVYMQGQWWLIHAVQNDPAQAMHACGCAAVRTPT